MASCLSLLYYTMGVCMGDMCAFRNKEGKYRHFADMFQHFSAPSAAFAIAIGTFAAIVLYSLTSSPMFSAPSPSMMP